MFISVQQRLWRATSVSKSTTSLGNKHKTYPKSSASAFPKESECFKWDAPTVNSFALVTVRVLGNPSGGEVKTGTSWSKDIWSLVKTQPRHSQSKGNQHSNTLWCEISCFFHRILFLLLTPKLPHPRHTSSQTWLKIIPLLWPPPPAVTSRRSAADLPRLDPQVLG